MIWPDGSFYAHYYLEPGDRPETESRLVMDCASYTGLTKRVGYIILPNALAQRVLAEIERGA